MDDVDSVWISVCYPVEFKENDEGVWIWKYVDNAKGRTTPILVPRAISHVELYEIVKGELKIDSSLYEIEMSCFDPNMPHVAAAPTIIDSDNNVKWFVSICRRAYLCVAVSEGAPKNREQFNIGALELRNDDEEQLEHMSRGKDIMQTKSVSIEHNGGGMLLDWNNIQCIPYSPQRPTPNDDDGLLLLENSSNSLENDNIDDNEVDVDGLESPIMNLTNANAPYHINEVSSQVVISSFSLVRSSSSVRIPEGEDIKAKQLFSTKKALTEKLQLLALKFHFEFKVKKSDKSVYTIVCVDENCGWRLRATKMKNSEIFEVRIYRGLHTCSMSIHRKDHKHASSMVIGNHVAPNYQDANRVYRPNDIISDIRRKFGIRISYTKAYMAKDYATALIRGNPHQSYAKLPSYCHVLELQNPGTLTFIHTTEDDCFLYFFMALGPSIRGFTTSMRRVISVDGTFLTSNRKGTLLLATCQDANYQIYPLAWGVVDSENNSSWTWFFQKQRMITGDTKDLVIISDRAACIKNGFERVFEFAHHGNCIYHIQKNLKSRFPKCDLAHLFTKTAEAYTVSEFENYFAALSSKKEGIDTYLLEEDFCYWSRAHFDGTRYNIMTSNNAETLNSLLKSAREFPILGLIDYIRETQQRWFFERHVEAEKCTTILTPSLEKKMYMNYNDSNDFDVRHVSPNIYDVGNNVERHIVDLEILKCTCRKFDLDKFPCVHAIAAIKLDGGDGYTICSPFYSTECWKRAYSDFVFPLPNEVEWKIPEHVRAKNVLPPLRRKQSGRPPKKRKRLAGEIRNPPKCSKCKKTGHNRSTYTSISATYE